MLLIKVEFFFFVFIYCTEQMNLKNISYWHYFTTKIMSICPIWNFTLYVTQSLHYFFFENHPVVSRYIFVPVSSQDLDFQRQMSWSFLCSVSSVKPRGYCWTCWCLWNWWPSLFKLPFHKTKIKGYAECIMIWQQQVYKDLLLHQFYCNLVWFENHNW